MTHFCIGFPTSLIYELTPSPRPQSSSPTSLDQVSNKLSAHKSFSQALLLENHRLKDTDTCKFSQLCDTSIPPIKCFDSISLALRREEKKKSTVALLL